MITGATGFLGGSLVDTFIEDNRVYSLGRNKSERCENIYWNLKEGIENIIMPLIPDTVIHCASIVGEGNYSKREYIEVNLISTIELLEYCVKAGVEHFVYISTGGVYGFGKTPFSEDDKPNPQGIYNISKYFSEELCMQYTQKLKITILRVFFPYGKGQKGRLVPNLINQIKYGEKVILNNEGKPIINPIYVGDFCNITKKIVNRRLSGIFNICGNEMVSIKELCEIISGAVEKGALEYCFNGKNSENMLGYNEKILNCLNYSIKSTISGCIKKMITT